MNGMYIVIYGLVMMKINFTDQYGSEDFTVGFFEQYVQKLERLLPECVEQFLKKKSGVINLVLLDDEEMRVINRDYRGKDKSTDVITFAYLEQEMVNPSAEVEVGDIFISIDTAKRQAEEKKMKLEKEMERLFVHGLLHLFGFDHNNDDEEEEMEKWAQQIQEG